MTVGEMRSIGVRLPTATPVRVYDPAGNELGVIGVTEVWETEKTADGGRKVLQQEVRITVRPAATGGPG